MGKYNIGDSGVIAILCSPAIRTLDWDLEGISLCIYATVGLSPLSAHSQLNCRKVLARTN
jgi:hypothetical protein